MGRSPCCDDFGIKKGPWTVEEDKKLIEYIQKNGHDNWRHLPKNAGLNRCGKSCRLRWINYLRPDIKRGKFTEDEEQLIIHLHSLLGNKWSAIARRLKGRTDNEIKNYWNTHLKKKLMLNGIDPVTHRRRTHLEMLSSIPNLVTTNANINVSNLNTIDSLDRALRLQLLQSLVQFMSPSPTTPNIDFFNSLGSPFIQNQVLMQDLSLPQLSNHYQTCGNPNIPIQRQEIDTHNYHSISDSNNHALFNSSVIPTNNSSPSLVLTTPEMFQPINSSDIPANSSSAEPILDDLDIDLSWKNILDQISWSDK